MLRRTFLPLSLAGATSALVTCRRVPPPVKIPDFASLDHLRNMLAEGQALPSQITAHSLEQIAKLDQAGLGIRAVMEINPEALALAEAGDQDIHNDQRRSALHGLPILIKDNIDTADGMETTAGSLSMLDNRPKQDAHLVKRLREAGMILLGKTNLSEWANLRSPKSTSGWSARGGLTRNPHRLTHCASGSSSGSAAAVAAGLVPVAIGTETSGSIVSPASACGIVGFKPTLGLISRAGIIPITHWQDTAGPMTLTVKDAALMMNVLAGSDPADAQTAEADARRASDYVADLNAEALRGKRLGVLRSEVGTHPRVGTLFAEALQALVSAGAIIIDSLELPAKPTLGRLSFVAMLTEFRQDLNAYLEARGGAMRSLADVLAFNRAHADRELPHFGQEFFEQAERLNTPEAREAGAEARRAARQMAGLESIDTLLQSHQLDALICPTNEPAGLIQLSKGDQNGRVFAMPAAVAGYPHLTVPMGLAEGLPVGLSFVGTAWSDAAVLSFGHAFECAMPARQAPSL